MILVMKNEKLQEENVLPDSQTPITRLNYQFAVILPHIINAIQPVTMKTNSNHFSP